MTIETIPIVNRKLVMFGETYANFGFLTSVGTYPSRAQRLKMRLRHLKALASWPFRWAALRAIAPVAERAFERSIFGFMTGLDPVLFPPERLLVTASCGFDIAKGSTSWLPIPEAIRVGESIQISDFFQSIQGGATDAEGLAVASLLQRVENLAASFKLMHTSYYRSDYVIQTISEKFSYEITLIMQSSGRLKNIHMGDVKTRSFVRTPSGDITEYEFESEFAKYVSQSNESRQRLDRI